MTKKSKKYSCPYDASVVCRWLGGCDKCNHFKPEMFEISPRTMEIKDVNELLRNREKMWYNKWRLAVVDSVSREVYWGLYMECRGLPVLINAAKRAMDHPDPGRHARAVTESKDKLTKQGVFHA